MLLWTLGCMYLQITVFAFSRYIPRSRIVGSYSNSIFSFLRNHYTVFHSDSIYIPTNSVWGFPFLHILFSICYLQTLMMAFLTVLRWSLIVVLICVALIINDIEHLFMDLLVICMSSLGKCCSLLPIFWLECLFLWYWVIRAICIF